MLMNNVCEVFINFIFFCFFRLWREILLFIENKKLKNTGVMAYDM